MIIIGINEYLDPKIPKLPGAEYDAKELYERLRDQNVGNFKIESQLVGERARCMEIRKAINDAFWKTDFYDLVLFYFLVMGLSIAITTDTLRLTTCY